MCYYYFSFTADGCSSNSTIIPSPSGLKLTLEYYTVAVVDCPCGSNGTSSGGKLRATRYCGGDFTNGAMCSEFDVT